MDSRHEDSRGLIQDLLVTPLDSVTEVRTRAGACRGNHFHISSHQWAYVVSGELLVATVEDDGVRERIYGPGEISHEPPGLRHAWRSLTDTTVLVFSKGPRAEDYEGDTVRLEVPILS